MCSSESFILMISFNYHSHCMQKVKLLSFFIPDQETEEETGCIIFHHWEVLESLIVTISLSLEPMLLTTMLC